MKLRHATKGAWSTVSALAAALAFIVQPFSSACAEDNQMVVQNGATIAYSGAEASWVNGELVLKYTDTTTVGKLVLPSFADAWILAVGGGGAGANPAAANARQGGAGGGGAGGFVEDTERHLQAGTYNIQVGAGGESPEAQGSGKKGSDSLITLNGAEVMRAVGGGGGGMLSAGLAGGSGGGGSKSTAGGVATTGQGNAGGSCAAVNAAGGGGGGAGAVGGNATVANIGGAGGEGKTSAITGTSVAYAGGGGGGTRNGTAGAGGAGGGGAGGGSASAAAAGTNGLGGGGGGGRLNEAGGKGGSGVVIIRITFAAHPIEPIEDNQSFSYTGSEIVCFPEDTTGRLYDIAGDAKAMAVGSYTFTVTPKEGVIWADAPTTEARTYSWSITGGAIQIQEFSLAGWQGDTPPNAIVLKTDIAITEADRIFYVAETQDGDWRKVEEGTLAGLTARAEAYWLKVEIPAKTGVYEGAVSDPISFNVWDSSVAGNQAIPGLGYRTKISVTAGALVELVISESTIPGFFYRHALPDGSDLRCAVVQEGELRLVVPEEFEWVPGGESKMLVAVPAGVSDLILGWGPLEGADLPELPTEPTALGIPIPKGEPVQHFNFDTEYRNIGTGSHGNDTRVDGERNPTFADGTMTGATPYSVNLVYPEEWSLFCRAKASPTVDNACLFAIGSYTAGFGLTTYRDGKVELRQWANANSSTVLLSTTVENVASEFHTYKFAVLGTRLSFSVDDTLVGQTTIVRRATANLQFNGFYGGNQGSMSRFAVDSAFDDWAVYTLPDAKVNTVSPVVVRDEVIAGTTLLANFWHLEPSIASTSWGVGEEPDVTKGIAAYGEPYFVMTDGFGTPLAQNTFPKELGGYTLVFTVDAGSEGAANYAVLKTETQNVAVTAHSPRTDLSGTAGSATLSGRVLLANNDAIAIAPITDQDYARTAETAPDVYWVHEGDNPRSQFPSLRSGSTHRLVAGTAVEELCGATEIWTLTDVYLGTPHDESAPVAERRLRNRLPYTSTSASDASKAVHLVMRNKVDAAIVSPCYTNGVGTIYFDAVNGWTTDAGTGYNLVVEVLRGQAAIQTPTTGSAWEPVRLIPLKRDATESEAFVRGEETEELALDIAYGQDSTANFYRVIASLDCREPVRFRIRRVTEPGESFGLDAGGFILLDNIIVSYPAMRADLSSCGWYDESKMGKQTLGFENAWSVPFPGCGDEVKGRARADYYTNPGDTNADTSAFITSANLHYRWRYLNQQLNDWSTVALDTKTLKAPNPLNLKNAAGEVLPGDVEFWFDLTLNAPYYKYVDYAAVEGFQMSHFYSEEITSVTNRAALAEGAVFASQGTDWFVRLREGKSDYEGVNLVVWRSNAEGEFPEETIVTGEGESATETKVPAGVQTIPMELIGNHIWRGYLQTRSALSAGARFRVEALNKQVADSLDWAENTEAYTLPEDITTLPASGILSAGAETDWVTLPVDGATGYLMVQVDDQTHSITIVHADYQNFNGWNDAKGSIFVGSSVADDEKSGVSQKAIEAEETFDTWANMSATNPGLWSEGFATSTQLPVSEYVTFPSIETPNGWSAGQGMYVFSHYRDDQNGPDGLKGRALQMAGQGRGYLQFVNAAQSPRGLENVSYTARIAQYIDFADFSYYDAPAKRSMTNYTFTARCAYDIESNTSFSGNASLSLVAYYRPGVGAYEFRLEQNGASRNGKGEVTGANANRQLLSLYKWSYDQATGKMTQKKLGSQAWSPTANTEGMPATSGQRGSYCPLYISVSNDVSGAAYIMGGMMKAKTGLAASSAYANQANNTQYFSVAFKDTDNPLKGGTYGVCSANSKGVFLAPFMMNEPMSFGSTSVPGDNSFKYVETTLTFPATLTLCLKDIYEENWIVAPGRMESFYETGTGGQGYTDGTYHQWGLRARQPAPQDIVIYTAAAGTQNWVPVATNKVSSFGTAAQPGVKFTVPLYTTENCSVRIEASGTLDDVRRDVVIDDVELRQWRGNDYTDVVEMETLIPDYVSETRDIHTNFVFTSAWIKDKALLLSAKRTAPGTPCAIRSPLMDGYDFGDWQRGIGLGMLSFSYENADPNTRLLLQIATNNVGTATLSNLDRSNESGGSLWTTVTNFTFAAGDTSGTRSFYVGLHGVKGAMRLMMDPTVVNKAATQNDPNYGSIRITKIFCRDEPKLDSSSWWGWNLRTVGADTLGRDAEGFLYLPDSSADAAQLGLSLALNNSVTDQTDRSREAFYKEHLPFLQTPTFAADLVGEVTFRARKYDTTSSQPAQLLLYGSKTGAEHGTWKLLEGGIFMVSNATYTTYNYKTNPGEDYSAFRLVVTGVDGVSDTEMGNRAPEGYDQPVRVLIDEVLVSEAVRARMGFRNVSPIRSHMSDMAYVPNTTDAERKAEQPLCGEAWGMECEVWPAQLPDEIDLTKKPRVRFRWFEGMVPWGYENWKTNALAKSAYLTEVPEKDLVFRSGYMLNDGAGVVPATTRSGTVYQYALEVEFYQVGSNVPVTNILTSADWELSKPTWYDPVDYNADPAFGKGETFSAYNIVDSVAPGWAWINEVNIFGDYDPNWDNLDRRHQYIEVAVPAEADISGWYINLIAEQESTGLVITNKLATFGENGLAGTKQGNIGMASNMVFRVIASPATAEDKKLNAADGTLDGTWRVPLPITEITQLGEVLAIYPIGFQLVRTSGVVEHEIVAMGTNLWDDPTISESLREQHDPEKVAERLNEKLRKSHFFFVGEDDGGTDRSLGVFDARGESAEVWNNTMVQTPGRINENQNIDPDHPTPNGESLIVYCNLDQTYGPIYQTVGDAVHTNGAQILYLRKGSDRGTNITYHVDAWYDFGAVNVTTNNRAIPTTVTPAGDRTWVVNVAANCSNTVTVVASAKIRDDIDASIADPRYRDAVIDWLTGGKTLLKGAFANNDEKIRLANYISYDRAATNELSLLDMYWLDMDPTSGDLALIAGMSRGPAPKVVTKEIDGESYQGRVTVTNQTLGVFMMITNCTEDVTSEQYGAAWSPYVIRGIVPGTTSWDYADGTLSTWDEATFKVTGVIVNGKTDIKPGSEDYIPVRWFVFAEDSFNQPDEERPFETTIDVNDPHASESPGYWSGWNNWPTSNVFWGWALDMRRKPYTVETLKKENPLE